MISNSYGEFFRITTFGESHGEGVGVVIDNCVAGLELSVDDIQFELNRRKPGQSKVSTMRQEDDKAEILSGVFEGKTTGTPIAVLVRNTNQRSKDYSDIKDLFRPGHADFTYFKKYGIRDYRGGGRSSARETIGRVASGAVAKKILKKLDIDIFAYTIQIGNVRAENFNRDFIEQNPVRTADEKAYPLMEKAIMDAKMAQDSIGGIIEVCIKNMPVGIGEPIFDRLNARLAYGILSIPAVKGIEFGAGFKVAEMKGSENNDEITPIDYIRANGNFYKNQIADLKILKSMSPVYRLIRLIELSMNSEDVLCKNKGYNFIKELCDKSR